MDYFQQNLIYIKSLSKIPNKTENLEKLSEIQPIYHHNWKISKEPITMLSVIEIPNQTVPLYSSSEFNNTSKLIQ